MKNLFLLLACFALLSLTSCGSRIEPGEVGILVQMTGGSAGEMELKGPGRVWAGIGEDLYEFPLYEQNFTWERDTTGKHQGDESIKFQTREGLEVNADFGVTFTFERDKVIDLFKRYRKSTPEEVVDGPLRNLVRDNLNHYASLMTADQVITEKNKLMDSVLTQVRNQMRPAGVNVSQIYLIGSFRLPPSIQASIDNRIKATQIAQQRENELREADAMARKKQIEAKGDSLSIVTRAAAEGKSNSLRQQTLTPLLIQQQWIEKWNGVIPASFGGGANTMMLVQPPH